MRLFSEKHKIRWEGRIKGNEEFEPRRSVGRYFVGPTASQSCKDRITVRRCRKRVHQENSNHVAGLEPDVPDASTPSESEW